MEYHCHVEVIEVDIRHGKRYDLSQPKVQKRWLQFVSEGRADALLVTPPCSTFSRASWANDEGPFPLRSSRCLRGFEWNPPSRKRKAELGNSMADFSFEAMKRQLKIGRPSVMEQPEDLGATKNPRVAGHQPGSMWQFSQHHDLLEIPGVASVVLAQLDFGTASPKPTRLLLKVPGPFHPEMYEGLPQFDAAGFYIGPLPRKRGEQLIGTVGGQFKTSAAAAWPPQLCEWVARQFLTSFRENSGHGKGQQADVEGRPKRPKGMREEEVRRGPERPKRMREDQEMGQTQKEVKRRREGQEEDEADVDPFLPPCRGGSGKARGCFWKGQAVPFHDGGCLLSPGRWDRAKRWHPGGAKWQELRRRLREVVIRRAGGEAQLERECFSMARGASGCVLAQDKRLLEDII